MSCWRTAGVSRIAPGLQAPGIPILDASGLVVSPGLIDIHVHLREPGREDEETIQSGSEAAAVGGFTSICCMPNTSPVNDNPAVTSFILKEAERLALTRVFPIGAISVGSAGERLAEIGEMVNAGAIGISDDGKGVMDGQLMRRALEYSLPFKIPVIEHCEDLNLSAHGCMNEGYQSTVLGLKGMSRTAEDAMAARDIMLAEVTRRAHPHRPSFHPWRSRFGKAGEKAREFMSPAKSAPTISPSAMRPAVTTTPTPR